MTLTALQPSAWPWGTSQGRSQSRLQDRSQSRSQSRPQSRPERWSARWDVRLAGREPGLAVTVSLPGVQRLVVADTIRSECREPVRRGDVIERSLVRDPARVAGALVGEGGQQRLCTGVVIVDLVDDPTDDAEGAGRCGIYVCDAPPAILLRPGQNARLLPDLAQGVGSALTVRAGDVLLVCSAALLEHPPAVLAGLRRPSGLAGRRADVEQVRQALAAAAFRGAAATVTRTARAARATLSPLSPAPGRGRDARPDVTVP